MSSKFYVPPISALITPLWRCFPNSVTQEVKHKITDVSVLTNEVHRLTMPLDSITFKTHSSTRFDISALAKVASPYFS